MFKDPLVYRPHWHCCVIIRKDQGVETFLDLDVHDSYRVWVSLALLHHHLERSGLALGRVRTPLSV